MRGKEMDDKEMSKFLCLPKLKSDTLRPLGDGDPCETQGLLLATGIPCKAYQSTRMSNAPLQDTTNPLGGKASRRDEVLDSANFEVETHSPAAKDQCGTHPTIFWETCDLALIWKVSVKHKDFAVAERKINKMSSDPSAIEEEKAGKSRRRLCNKPKKIKVPFKIIRFTAILVTF